MGPRPPRVRAGRRLPRDAAAIRRALRPAGRLLRADLRILVARAARADDLRVPQAVNARRGYNVGIAAVRYHAMVRFNPSSNETVGW